MVMGVDKARRYNILSEIPDVSFILKLFVGLDGDNFAICTNKAVIFQYLVGGYYQPTCHNSHFVCHSIYLASVKSAVRPATAGVTDRTA